MKAVFLIHGFATDRNDFARIAPMLKCRYDEVYCPNLPNHGAGTEREKIHFKAITDFVLEAFDYLKNKHETVDVIGFSMGGALATFVASKREVNRLILLAPANKHFAPAFLFKTVKRVNELSPKRKKKGKKIDEGSISAKEIINDFNFGIKLFVRRILPKYSLRNVREFKKIIKHCNENLGDLKMPTLLLWGKIDQLVPYGTVKFLCDHCRHHFTRVIIYPDISHLMLHSCAHFRIADDIFKFLEDTDPPMLEYSSR